MSATNYGLSEKQQKVFKGIKERLNASIKEGIAKTNRLPWNSKIIESLGLPTRINGEKYKGKNVWIFSAEAIAKGYTSNTWIGYKEAARRGGQVRKGEKATTGVNRYWAPFKCKVDCTKPNHCIAEQGEDYRIRIDEETGKPIGKMRLTWFNVFNSDQIDWSEAKGGKPCHIPTGSEFESEEYADKILKAYLDKTGVTFREVPIGDQNPHYNPNSDTVNLPLKVQFEEASAYYSAAFHEIGHSTSKEGRVHRVFNYGMHKERGLEEMSVEWAAAYLQNWCGIKGAEDAEKESTAYIQSWSNAIDKDPDLIFDAMDMADRISNFILKQCEDC